MKPLNRFNLVSLCAIALTTACGTETPNRLAAPATPLEGQWIKKCEANDGQSSVETLSVTGDRVDRRVTVFWGETCSPGSEFFVARLSARQKIGARMSSDQSLTEIDIYDKNKFIRVFDDAAAHEMNKINLYGRNDWAVGIEENLTNLDEAGRVTPETTTYTVFSLEGSKLCIAKATEKPGGSTQERRIQTTDGERDCYLKQ